MNFDLLFDHVNTSRNRFLFNLELSQARDLLSQVIAVLTHLFFRQIGIPRCTRYGRAVTLCAEGNLSTKLFFPLIFEKLTRHISELYYDNFMDRSDSPSLCFRVEPATEPFKQRFNSRMDLGKAFQDICSRKSKEPLHLYVQ